MEYKPEAASDDLMESSYSVPTVSINRFLVNRVDVGLVRIALGEGRNAEAPVNWRGSIVLTPYQAWELTKLIQSLLGEEYAAFDKAQSGGADG
jgi:hypothetical protein